MIITSGLQIFSASVKLHTNYHFSAMKPVTAEEQALPNFNKPRSSICQHPKNTKKGLVQT